MPRHYLIHAPRDQERLPHLLEQLGATRPTPSNPALLFVPTEQRLMQLRQWLPAGMVCHVTTLQRFLWNQRRHLRGQRGWLDDQEQRLLLQQLLEQQCPTFLSQLPFSWTLVSKVAYVLALVRQTTDDPAERRALFQQLTEQNAAAEALAEVDARYYRSLWELSLLDQDILRQELIAHWQREGRVGKFRVLVVDGFSFFFTPAQRSIFSTMIPLFDQVIVTLSTPRAGLDSLARHPGYAYAHDAYQWLQAFKVDWHQVTPEDPPEPTWLAEVQESLFTDARLSLPMSADRLDTTAGEDVPTFNVSTFQRSTISEEKPPLRLLSLADPRLEAQAVARLIRLGLDAGDRPEHHRVVLLQEERYRSVLAEACASYRLPAGNPSREPLRANPLIGVIRKWLEGARAGWMPEDLYAALTSAWVDFPNAPVERLERLRRAAGVRDRFYPDGWMRSIKTLLQRRYLHAGPIPQEVSTEPFEEERAQTRRDIEQIAPFLRQASQLLNASTPVEYLTGIRKLLVQIGIHARVQENDNPAATRTRLAYKHFQALLDRVQAIFELLPANPTSIAACQEYLDHLLDTEQIVIEQAGEGIPLMSLAEAASVQHDTVYLIGCTENALPAKAQRNFLLGSDAVGRVPVAGLDLLPEQRFLFQQVIGNAQRVVITYPRRIDGREIQPSPFIEDLRSLIPVEEEITLDDIGQLTPEERAPCLSTSEALIPKDCRLKIVDCRSKISNLKSQICNLESHHIPYPNLRTQLGSEIARSRRQAFSEYDGWLNKSAADLAWNSLELRYYSTTMLERYAGCPMRFFFHDVLKLKEPETVEVDVAPSLRGILVHRILERFYHEHPELRKRDPEDYTTAREALARLAEDEAGRYDDEYPNLYWHADREALLRGLADDEPAGVLRAWLDAEWNRSQEPLVGERHPTFSEYRFGPLGRRPGDGNALQVTREQGADVLIRGTVDRVDQDDETFVVYDYKTGSTVSVAQREQGLSFQLAIYLMALEQNGLGYPVAGAYYLLSRPDQVRKNGFLGDEAFWVGKGRRPHRLYPTEQFRAMLDWTRENLRAIDRYIQQGRFHPSLWDENRAGCRYCAYAEICRYQATRQLNMQIAEGTCYQPIPFGTES